MDRRIDHFRWRRYIVNNLSQQYQLTFGLEGQSPCECGIGHHAQAVHIGSAINRVTVCLFGGHVSRCAYGETGHGHDGMVRRHVFCHAEIGDQRPAIRGKHDVTGFDVPVQNVDVVCIVDALGNL